MSNRLRGKQHSEHYHSKYHIDGQIRTRAQIRMLVFWQGLLFSYDGILEDNVSEQRSVYDNT